LRFRRRDIKDGFVCEPRHAVEEADQLVTFVIGRLPKIFANQRVRMKQEWC